MNIKNGQKFGLKTSIKRLISQFKNNILLVFLVTISIAWIFSADSYSLDFVSKEAPKTKVDNKEREIVGIAKVKDGDSILISGKYEIRLMDIDAPEYKQKCLNKHNKEYYCGKTSLNFLRRMIHGKKITCKYKKKDMYDRFLSYCYLGHKNINYELLHSGMAIVYSFDGVNQDIYDIERIAKHKKVGIWQGAFLEPRKYRKKNKK